MYMQYNIDENAQIRSIIKTQSLVRYLGEAGVHAATSLRSYWVKQLLFIVFISYVTFFTNNLPATKKNPKLGCFGIARIAIVVIR